MLPSDWVDRIFARMAVRYGAHWLRLWEGVDITAVKADWAETLSGFTADDIAYAIDHLPSERPPTVGQFRDLCRRSPRNELPALPAPREKPPSAIVEKLLKGLGVRRRGGPREWAHKLQEREKAGEILSLFQKHCMREALAAPKDGEE